MKTNDGNLQRLDKNKARLFFDVTINANFISSFTEKTENGIDIRKK